MIPQRLELTEPIHASTFSFLLQRLSYTISQQQKRKQTNGIDTNEFNFEN